MDPAAAAGGGSRGLRQARQLDRHNHAHQPWLREPCNSLWAAVGLTSTPSGRYAACASQFCITLAFCTWFCPPSVYCCHTCVTRLCRRLNLAARRTCHCVPCLLHCISQANINANGTVLPS